METISRIPVSAARDAGAFGGSFSGRLAAAFGRLFTWMERTRQRQALAALDGHLLKDIGLTRTDVYDEVRKPFWQG
jgi:uncharacterized protein YjiS (DUF1127 family)